jgi:hypothetical protein
LSIRQWYIEQTVEELEAELSAGLSDNNSIGGGYRQSLVKQIMERLSGKRKQEI